MNRAYLLLGSNMNDPKARLNQAEEMIREKIGSIINKSSHYLTAAWGLAEQPDFINQVLEVDTQLEASDTIKIILQIEEIMGRRRTVKNAPRIIDIDILFFNHEIIDITGLMVPHPAIQERRFVLEPMYEIAPQLIHPLNGLSIKEMLRICPDSLAVKKI